MTSEFTASLSRRTLAKGAAWALPAVSIAAAAPLMASSPPCVTYSFDGGSSCRWPGNSNSFAYRLYLKICNGCLDETLRITFTIDHLTNNSNKALTACGTVDYTVDVTLEPSQCAEVWIGDFRSSSSASSIIGYDASGNILFSAAAPTQSCTGITNTCTV